MKQITLTILVLAGFAFTARGADQPVIANTRPKEKVTFEYTYPPLPPEKAKPSAELLPVPKVGTVEWLKFVEKRDRHQIPPWQMRRLQTAWSASEVPPWANVGFTSTAGH